MKKQIVLKLSVLGFYAITSRFLVLKGIITQAQPSALDLLLLCACIASVVSLVYPLPPKKSALEQIADRLFPLPSEELEKHAG